MFKQKINLLSSKLRNSIHTDFFYDRIVILALTLALLSNLAIFILLVLKIKPQEALIPVHYNVYTGASQLGRWYQIYQIPFCGLFIIVLNSFLASVLYERERLISFFFVLISFLVQIFLLFQVVAFIRFIGD